MDFMVVKNKDKFERNVDGTDKKILCIFGLTYIKFYRDKQM